MRDLDSPGEAHDHELVNRRVCGRFPSSKNGHKDGQCFRWQATVSLKINSAVSEEWVAANSEYIFSFR